MRWAQNIRYQKSAVSLKGMWPEPGVSIVDVLNMLL
jgi:hypothetical protein